MCSRRPGRVGLARFWGREHLTPYLNVLCPQACSAAACTSLAASSFSRRLTEVKAKYDPENAFHHNKNIPPRLSGGDGRRDGWWTGRPGRRSTRTGSKMDDSLRCRGVPSTELATVWQHTES